MLTEEIPAVHGVVSFLDILGTKSMWQGIDVQSFLKKVKKVHDEFHDLTTFQSKLSLLKSVTYTIDDVQGTPFKEILPIPDLKLDVSTFSDTIILALYQDFKSRTLPDSLLIYMVGYFLVPIFRRAFENKIFLRGTVSIGKFFINKGANGILLVGPAVNDAAQSYEAANWIGISTSQNATLTLEQEKGLDNFLEESAKVTASNDDFSVNLMTLINTIKSSFINYDIPRKDGLEKKGWALAWPTFHDNGLHYRSQASLNNIIEEELSYQRYQENSTGYDIYIKFKNTRTFFEDCRAFKEIDAGKLA